MNRRAFLTIVGGSILVVPFVAGAWQAGRVYRIGFLRAGPPLDAYIEGFREGLREWGHVDGRDVVVEFRATDGTVDQLPQLAEELLRLKVDVIVASAAPAALAARKATGTVPIVFVNVLHPVELGLVSSRGTRVATSPDWPVALLTSPASGWNYCERPFQGSGESQHSGIRTIRRTRSNLRARRQQRAHLVCSSTRYRSRSRLILTLPSRLSDARTVCYRWRVPFSQRIALAWQSWQSRAGCLRSMARRSMSRPEASCHLARTIVTCTDVPPYMWTRS